MVYVQAMARLGSERIAEMFAALGLGTEAERQRYCALAKVGVVDVVQEEKPLVFLHPAEPDGWRE
jgi:hypothetical protein